jgi:hypothetical protein
VTGFSAAATHTERHTEAQMDEEHARLPKALEEILRQVTPNRFAVPTACGCARVAMYLMALYQNPKKLKPKVVKSGEDFQRGP